jgi:hypothetical protein
VVVDESVSLARLLLMLTGTTIAGRRHMTVRRQPGGSARRHAAGPLLTAPFLAPSRTSRLHRPPLTPMWPSWVGANIDLTV